MVAAQQAQEEKVPVFTVALASLPPPELEQIAEISGGQAFTAPTSEQLNAVYRDLGTRLTYVEEKRELTSYFMGGAAILLLLGAAASITWFLRLPDQGRSATVAGRAHVDPDQAMVGGREGEHADQPEQRVGGQRPEHRAVEEFQVLARQDVVGAQVARPGHVEEVGGVEGGVAPVGQVGPTLEDGSLGPARAGRGRRC